jgi:DNA-binding NarL/FixJ family response regulator
VALRVLIVDDRPEVRVLVRTHLRLTREVEIVGEAGTGDEAVRMTRDLRPEAVVLDLKLPDVSGRDLCTLVQEASPESRVIVFTAYYSADKAWYLARGVPVLSKEDADGLVSAVLG